MGSVDVCAVPKIDSYFLLTLPKSRERRERFMTSFNRQGFKEPFEIIWGVDTRQPENAERYRNLVNPIKFQHLYSFENGIPRPDEGFFNAGALGCYIGHMNFYKKCFEKGLKFAVIFEDNVYLDKGLKEEFYQALEKLGSDFEACFFHCWIHLGDNVQKCGTEKIRKVKYLTSCKMYIINVENMKKYYPLFYPIDTHVDIIYEHLIRNGARVYLIPLNNLKLQKDTKSLINHSPVINPNPFRTYGIEEKKNLFHCTTNYV
jgi:GR25 family glycosyltransferase involved in LPS biosynthesis